MFGRLAVVRPLVALSFFVVPSPVLAVFVIFRRCGVGVFVGRVLEVGKLVSFICMVIGQINILNQNYPIA